MSANMGQSYNIILGQFMNFARLKLGSLSGWEAPSENSNIIFLVKGIKGLIFKHKNVNYLYTGIRSTLRGFLNLHQGVMLVTEYHNHWISGKELVNKFGYKVSKSDFATDRECEADGISISDPDYVAKRWGVKAAAR